MPTIAQVLASTTFENWRLRTNEISGTINVTKVGTPTLIETADDFTNYTESAGIFSGCGITDNADGTIDVASGEAILRVSNTAGAELISAATTGDTAIALTDNDLNYIYLNYNGGTPVIGVTVTSATVNGNDICLIAIISREGNNLTILEATSEISDQYNKLHNMLVETEGFKHVSGCALSETGTRHLSASTGAFYRGLTKYTNTAFDTSASDTFEYYYRDGGSGWTEVTAQTQINNLNYDDGDGTLGVTTAEKFVPHWVYLKAGTNNELFVIYGQNEYDTVNAAQIEDAPTGLPAQLDELGILIGRVIIQQGATSLSLVETSFGDSFKGNVAVSGTGGLVLDTKIKTANYTAESGDTVIVNTTSTAWTLTLPPTPAVNDYVGIIDSHGQLSVNNLTVGRNGSNIMSLAEDLTVDTDYSRFNLIYVDATIGWVIQ